MLEATQPKIVLNLITLRQSLRSNFENKLSVFFFSLRRLQDELTMHCNQFRKLIAVFAPILLFTSIGNILCDNHLAKLSDASAELIGYCAPYHGKVCKSYITTGQVWYSNVSVPDSYINQFSVVHKVCILIRMGFDFAGRSGRRLEKWANNNGIMGRIN